MLKSSKVEEKGDARYQGFQKDVFGSNTTAIKNYKETLRTQKASFCNPVVVTCMCEIKEILLESDTELLVRWFEQGSET